MQSNRYSCDILIKLEYSRQICRKNTQRIKCHENPSSGSRVVPCGRTDMANQIVAFRNFANAPKNCCRFSSVGKWLCASGEKKCSVSVI